MISKIQRSEEIRLFEIQQVDRILEMTVKSQPECHVRWKCVTTKFLSLIPKIQFS